jgi:gliding motility-associated-like protein
MIGLRCRILCLWGLFFLSGTIHAQCFTIESILVDACAPTGNEGQNEMVRFVVGGSDLNTVNMNVNWATTTNSWDGICQNATTASIVTQLNATILNCGVLLEPTAGVLPANSKVILVSGYTSFSVTSNSFAALSDTIYIIFHCSSSTTGNFSNSGTGIKTFSLSFSPSVGTCNETVSYLPSSLVGGNGAFVDFTPSGTASYGNNNCTAPITLYDPSWTLPLPMCSGAASIDLNTLITGTPGGSWEGPGVIGNTFSPAGLLGDQDITYTFSPGCANAVSLTQTISVISGGSPTWSPTSICSNSSTFELNSLITGNSGGTWSGLGVTGNTFNPNVGSQNITYSIGTGSCAASLSQIINVVPQPNQLSISGITNYCSGESMSALNTIPSNGLSVFWFSDIALTNQINATNSFTPPSSSSTYYVYQGTSSCHSLPTAVSILINPTPIAPSLPAQVQWCSGTSFPSITTTSSASIINWYSDAALTNLVGTGNSFQISSSTIPTYYVNGETNGCTSNVTSVNFTIELPVNATIVGNSVIEACLPEVVTLQSSVLTGNSWSTGATTQSISVIEAGVYTLNVVGFCNTSTDFVTVVDVSADASFQIELDNPGMLPLTATLIPTGNSSDNCTWFVDGVLQSFNDESVLIFTQDGNYEIMQQCSNASGCIDKVVQYVNANFPNDFYIPNAFTPNGDGINDVFGVKGVGIEKLLIRFFNSWGEEVFIIENPDQTWDGKMSSGEILPDGLYVYKLEAVNKEGKPSVKNGSLMLIK